MEAASLRETAMSPLRYLVVPLLLVPALAAQPLLGADGPPEALALVDAMIAAHGGMDLWADAPTVSFTDEFRPGEAAEGAPMRVTVEQGPRRAYLDAVGSDMRMAWDGERAWSEGWAVPMPPRFLALLDYYFLNLPWLARDPGVNLSEVGRAEIPGDPTGYRTIRMTFDPGTGDTPDDYYLLYIDPETQRLKATEYIVTYRALLAEGEESSPLHLLVYDEWTTVDGLVVPTHYSIYEGETVYATNRIGDWSFSRPFDLSRMEMPEGAVVDTSTP
jgi:hypothetical protein